MSDNDDYTNQQTWASMAYDLIRAELLPDAPERAVVTYGFPHAGDKARGECWLTKAGADIEANASEAFQADASAVIFIHPSQWRDAETTLIVLTHEMIHATGVLNHGQAYKAMADTIDLGTSEAGLFDTPGETLGATLKAIAETLPEFPVSAMRPDSVDTSSGGTAVFVVEEPTDFCKGGIEVNPDGTVPKPPKQTTRMKLHQCRCGEKIRAARENANAECTKCHSAYRLVLEKGKNPYGKAANALCQIQWVDANGKPTPDNDPAVAQIKTKFPIGGTDEERTFYVCAKHYKQYLELPPAAGWSEVKV